MGRILKIVVRDRDDLDRVEKIYRFRNFGEDVYKFCRDTGEASILLQQVDSSIDTLLIRDVKTRRVRRVKAAINEMLQRHFFDDCQVTVIESDD
jgi:hypothetical protein